MDFVGDLKVNYGHFYFSVFADSATGRVGTIVSTAFIGGKCSFCHSEFVILLQTKKNDFDTNERGAGILSILIKITECKENT